MTKAKAPLMIYTAFAIETLDGRDLEMMCRHLDNIDANLDIVYAQART